MTNTTRHVGGWGGLGNDRYRRYVAAFDWTVHCVDKGYYLEAIAILDSLICDRLGSRLGYLKGKSIDSCWTSGKLCRELIGTDSTSTGSENDAAFRNVIRNIQNWVKRRNDSMHATAKVFRGASSNTFKAILQSHMQDAVDGIKCLQDFDDLDKASRAKAEKHPASYPDAFFPKRRRMRYRPSLINPNS